MPGTIGAIVWLSRNQAAVERIRHGLVLTCVGDSGPLTYKKSRRGDADIRSGDDANAARFGAAGAAGFFRRRATTSGNSARRGLTSRSAA